MFVAREFLPVVLDDEKEKDRNNRVSTEKKFKALRTHSLNVKLVLIFDFNYFGKRDSKGLFFNAGKNKSFFGRILKVHFLRTV